MYRLRTRLAGRKTYLVAALLLLHALLDWCNVNVLRSEGSFDTGDKQAEIAFIGGLLLMTLRAAIAKVEHRLAEVREAIRALHVRLGHMGDSRDA